MRTYYGGDEMKNKTVEYLKLSAKQYHRSKQGDHFENGIRIYHLYDAADQSRLSWWDDVTFILNDYRVTLAWVHPRMAYEDMIDEEVARMTADFPTFDFPGKSTPIFKPAGKSRKTVSFWRSEPVDRSDWRKHREAVRAQVVQTAGFKITPYLKSEWGKRSRFVSLCMPFEVRNENDLRALSAMAKRLLKREVSLEDLFPNYIYTKADWERENLHLADTGIHSHQVAP